MKQTISERARQTWERSLRSAGKKGFVKLVSGYGSVDFETGERSSDTLTETDLIAFVSDIQDEARQDKRVLASGLTAITVKDRLKIDGVVHKISGLKELNHAGVVVGYDMRAEL